MLLQAAKDLNVDLSASFMIGDILNDVEAGKRAGCKAILIDNGNETEWILNEQRTPDLTVKNFKEAAEWIARHTQQATQ
jgi:phosphoglycolate phosphatase-like HAD superfamily hydrolase